jgi:hypothetical protein
MSKAADAARSKERQIIQDRDKEIASINANPEWTHEAKQARIKPVRDWARDEVRALREAEKARREQAVRETKVEVYRVPTPDAALESERATVWAGFRAARAEVNAATNTGEMGLEDLHNVGDRLADMLDEATLTGDDHLARATYVRSLELGVESVRDRYLASRPTERKKYEAYAEAQAEAEASQSLESILENSFSEALIQ